jgi:hypothetical protein
LYTGKLDYKKTEDDLISILATARFFSLDSVADSIANAMLAIVSIENVVYFYYSFGCYGYPQYESKLLAWILGNFSFWNETKHEAFATNVLAHIEEILMEWLVSHENFIVKNELTLYNILKRWLVDKMKLRDDYDYFKIWNRPEPFLESDEGKKFERVFSKLNLNQLCMDPNAIDQLEKDKILPISYIHRAGAENYLRLVDPPESGESSYRLAIIHGPSETAFKTTSIDFQGIHLKFSWVKNLLMLTRSQDKPGLHYSASINIHFRVAFYTPEDFESASWNSSCFEIKEGFSAPIFAWERNQEDLVMTTVAGFPRVIGIQMMMRS